MTTKQTKKATSTKPAKAATTKVEKPTESHRHIIACLVDNEFGVLARVVGLFSGQTVSSVAKLPETTSATLGLTNLDFVTSLCTT